ncbi:succinyl-CoA:3-ketoacid-coenzyme A transferase 1, mitochondrial precursor [Purpureocillium lavendulum]|uniref:Succinyl-CoA:3-ketoacid-coenzyme A transferase 1, mitochondrial n=1 Tax=Purpureocillium lavendulum TaxID=1247861 RepID=A0AB34FPW4_9HYPO|nr:succinyl-CoA:3-ketoacid-coenzyme A transferase 1, mitochondrial precursor [Purpureocillium lavendulum]
MVMDYDSDSTEGDYTETNVLLGYASKDADEDTISKLGGHPDWLDAENPPSAAYARCKACKDLMVLLLQLNGELPERFPGHERRLYVFACRRSGCRRKDGSVRVLRGVKVWEDEAAAAIQMDAQTEEEAAKEAPEAKNEGPGLGEALFGATKLGGGANGGTNPFSSSANPFSAAGSSNPFSSPSSASANPFASQPAKEAAAPSEQANASSLSKTFAETLSLNTPPPSQPPPPAEPWPETASRPKPYPTLYLADADYETLDPTPEQGAPANVRIEDADAPEPSILDREAFESTMDAAFQKFADRLAQNPDQVIRYEFGGTPLLYSKTDAVGKKLLHSGGPRAGIPGCANCGGRRTFEVQLTPNAIAELEADDLSLEGMEWGTIVVGVCEKDCAPRQTEKGEAGYLEEWAGVQWEELSKQN